MKKIIFAFVLLAGFSANAQEIKWMSFEEALEAQKTEPKKMMVDFYTNWCGWCKKMDKETFTNKDVISYVNEKFYAVKFNAEGNDSITYKGNIFTNPQFDASKIKSKNSRHQLAYYFGVQGFPSLVYLDEEANLIGPIPGYKSVSDLELHLKLFGNDDYKNIEGKEHWEKYIADFNYTFKE